MRVDQHAVAGAVERFVVAGEMDLADQVERKAINIGVGVEPVIDRRHHDIVDVEQQAAAGAPGDRQSGKSISSIVLSSNSR
jgi:hypothetical protein